MRILILGAGKMGSFFTDVLSFQHETAVFDVDPKRLRFVYNTYRYTTLEEIEEFKPELVINAATVKYTLDAFHQVLPALPKDCIISDIASVKTGLKEFYDQCGFRYVSTHPMFGPTFANLDKLSTENAIIISEGDHLGKIFFKDLYQNLGLNILNIPLKSTMRQWPIRYPSLLFPLSFCGSDEASGRSRYYFQTPHEDSQRSIERRRLPVAGNFIQSPHPCTGRRYPYRIK